MTVVDSNLALDNLALDEGTLLRGIPTADEHRFVSVSPLGRLFKVVTDPRELQPGKKHRGYDAAVLDAEAEVHELVQRALTGAKRQNVPKYAAYIEGLALRGQIGVLPPIHLWTSESLRVVQNGCEQYLLVPDEVKLTSIDGETQLMALYDTYSRMSPEEQKSLAKYPLEQVVHHGIGVEAAQKYFHDLNVLAVRPNVSLSLAMDSTDPLMRVVKDVEAMVPFVTGQVERQARQLSARSPKVITVQSLRAMTINTYKGIAGVQYGAKPAPVDGIDLDRVRDAAGIWLNAFFQAYGEEVRDRARFITGAPPILAAVGAMGQRVFQAAPEDRESVAASLVQSLRDVDWEKGERWVGIAGAIKARGFSVNSTKECAYAVFNVLTDPANAGHARVRVGTVAATPHRVAEATA
jgi:DNA sulfur modification protein DndB